jgi:pyruvate formate lyase activating enzyme
VNQATIFNIQRFSLHDGPGIRTTVFLKGCPLRCQWCHNPESFDPVPELAVAGHRCVGCDLCVPVCGPGVAGRVDVDSLANPSANQCEQCGNCSEACPAGAREMLGQGYNVQELLGELTHDGVYFEESAGGVTFSGGEPLSGVNAPFVLECLAGLRESGYHTIVDTCGYVNREDLQKAARLTDLFLFDLKIMDPDRHLEAVGCDNSLILENLGFLVKEGHRVWVRVPLIPGMTDDRENLEAVARFLGNLSAFGQVPPVHLLPFHRTAADKYQRLGRINPMADTREMTESEIETRAGWMKKSGLEVHIGG